MLPADIEQTVVSRRGQRGQHCQWALLCEEAGLMGLAFSELQLALRDNPQDALAMWRLAQHYRERAEFDRAIGLVDRLLEREPANEAWLNLFVEMLREENALPRALEAVNRAVAFGLPAARADALRRSLGARPQAPPGATAAADLHPTDADCIRFHTLFAGREDVHARQWARKSGEMGYSPVQEPLTPAVIRNHLLGGSTVGVYVLRLDATAAFFALDIDIEKQALSRARGDPDFAQSLRASLNSAGRNLLDVLRGMGFQPAFENSGYKGRHLWVFLEQPLPAEVLHLFGRKFLAWQAPALPEGLSLEFFPKQAALKGQGLGNLIKLPLGIHRRTGYRSLFLDDDGRPLPNQLDALKLFTRASPAVVQAALERLKQMALPDEPPAAAAAAPAARGSAHAPPRVAAPLPPEPAPVWTEADFQHDPRMRHLLKSCPVLSELKRGVDEHRRLSHEEQLVLIHTLGHVEGGPQAVNYLFQKCLDVGPEKFMKDRLKGSPVSCPSIRKKIPQITRRVPCNCPFEFAADRYPTPVLHLLTLPADQSVPPPAAPADDLEGLARRFGVLEQRRAEIQQEWEALRRALVAGIAALPERELACPGGRYRVETKDGVDHLLWNADPVKPP
jgi:hypothetical protein